MRISETLVTRIADLVNQVPTVFRVTEHGQVTDVHQLGACIGWISAAVHAVQAVCVSAPKSAYLVQALELQKTADSRGFMVHRNVIAMAELLKQLKCDIDNGLLTTIENQISAETFDDLLDHAEAYLAEGRKDPAGVIAGVVFEDTVRRLCQANDINTTDQTSEPLINALKVAGVLTKLESKEAKTASDLRANATHAWWEKFAGGQVQSVIEFTRRLIREKLAR